jgi:ligand-binding sensor domain-containing protein
MLMRLRSELQLVGIVVAGILWLGGSALPTLAHDLSREFTQFHITRWNAENGLPSSSVSSIVQTQDGYIWFGTYSGLARFDGVRFTVFDSNSGKLPHNEVVSLLATKDGALWIGTTGGAARYFQGRFEAFGANRGLPEAAVGPFTESGGRIFAVVQNHGIYRLEDGRFRPFGPAGLSAMSQLQSLQPAPGGGIWVAGNAGVVQVSTFGAARSVDPAKTGPVRVIFADTDSSLWAGTSKGELMHLRNGVWEKVPVPQILPRKELMLLSMMRDRAGTLWIGSDNSGLIAMAGSRIRAYKYSPGLPEPRITAVLEDAEGSLWLGMPVFGALQVREGRVVPMGQAEGLNWDVALSVMQSRDGTVWAGLEGGGLNLRQNGRWRVINAPQVLGGTVPYTMLESRDGSVWVATDNAWLHRFRNGALVQKLKVPGHPGNPASIAEDAAGTIWLGASHGLYQLHGSQWTEPAEGSGPPWSGAVSAILPTPQGGVLAATDSGLWLIFGGRSVVVPGTEGKDVQALLRDSQGIVWAGLYGVGLLRVQSGRIHRFGPSDGLPETQIVSLVEDGRGKLWMGGARGVYSASLEA